MAGGLCFDCRHGGQRCHVHRRAIAGVCAAGRFPLLAVLSCRALVKVDSRSLDLAAALRAQLFESVRLHPREAWLRLGPFVRHAVFHRCRTRSGRSGIRRFAGAGTSNGPWFRMVCTAQRGCGGDQHATRRSTRRRLVGRAAVRHVRRWRTAGSVVRFSRLSRGIFCGAGCCGLGRQDPCARA